MNEMENYRHLVKDAYDLHVHSAPDVMPRKFDDVEMVYRIKKAGMKGFTMKSHYFNTGERADTINTHYKGCHAIGAITLNQSVGGLNPAAVEMAARSGATFCWLPTVDSEHERKYVFDGNLDKKMPYWAQIALAMKEEGTDPDPITLFDDAGKLKPQVYDILDIIAKHNMVLATGHVSHEEAFAVIKAANERKVQKKVITHVGYPTTRYTLDEQKEFVKMGAIIEHTYTSWSTKKYSLEEAVNEIMAIGKDHVIIATDCGASMQPYPDDAMLEFSMHLAKAGMKEDDIIHMNVHNTHMLVKK